MNCWSPLNSEINRPGVRIPRSLLAAILIASGSAAWAAEPSLPYTVRPSDKLIVLAREMLHRPSDWNEVARFNKMKDPNFIKPGQRLEIPLRLLRSAPAAGTLVSAEGDVQLGGSAAATGSAIGEGSRLQVGANSSAVVELHDGSRVKLLPNTLAEVVTSRDYALRDASASGSSNWFSGLIRLSQGAIETLASKVARRAAPLQVETPTSLVGVRGTEFRVAYDNSAERLARTEVTEGLVRADNPAQQSGADLPQGTGAVINPAQKAVNVVQLLRAPDLAGVPAEVQLPQGLWPLPSLEGASSFRVQVASDAKFDKIVRDLKAAGPGVELAGLTPGDWYARVRGIDGQGLEGFDAVKLIAVRDGRWPVGNTGIRALNGDTLLNFGVAPDAVFTKIEAELALDAAFTRRVRQDTLTTPLWNLGTLDASTVYYVRFRLVNASGQSRPSETYRFQLPGNWGTTVFDVASPLQRLN
ncbi:FecR domain-containing protein [Variovorax terrae]|uniref:FecR domain-containing protein n=1 Tax=Variovorax terrae TaxID=2923278 RepID=A0A9X2ALM4_9BURK|nr:FecR domain-containing protein [Variovorax terrae]MCJ0762469.1 FecR domain-containing protein [Variovorax terrae]